MILNNRAVRIILFGVVALTLSACSETVEITENTLDKAKEICRANDGLRVAAVHSLKEDMVDYVDAYCNNGVKYTYNFYDSDKEK